jgi:hypothetical protein
MLSRYLLFTVSLFVWIDINSVNSSSNAPDALEEDFHNVIYTNRGAEALFPKTFTTEEMHKLLHPSTASPLRADQTLINAVDEVIHVPVGTLTPTDVFSNRVAPSMFQILTGTPDSYAGRITFGNLVIIRDGQIYGEYLYKRAFPNVSSWLGYGDTVQFHLKLNLHESYIVQNLAGIEGTCKIFNMRESVLGDRDFLSNKDHLNPANNILPTACLHNIKLLDRECILQSGQQKGSLERLAGNTKDWLLMLRQLQGKAVYFGLSVKDQRQQADLLYRKLLAKHKFTPETMTVETYAVCLMPIRAKIFKCLGLHEDDIPVIPEGDVEQIIAMREGKIFFAVADRAEE